MKLFKTGSATVVSDCQKFFRFLLVTYKSISELQIFWINLCCLATTVYVWYLSAMA